MHSDFGGVVAFEEGRIDFIAHDNPAPNSQPNYNPISFG